MVMSKHSLGIFIDGENLRLALLSRWFKKIQWIEGLSIEKFAEKPPSELQKQITELLKKNNAVGCRSVFVIPRSEVIVRQIKLPIEAESNLAKVIEYQLAGLLPSDETSVTYDYFASRKQADSKTLGVTIFVVLRSVLEKALGACRAVGLKVDRIIPSNVAISNYYLLLPRRFPPSNAVFVYVNEQQAELIGIVNRSFHQSRTIQFSTDDDLVEGIRTEVEAFREQAQVPDGVPLDVFLVGHAEKVWTADTAGEGLKIHQISGPSTLGFEQTGIKLEGLKLADYFLPITAALSGFERKNPIPVNLLPPEERPQKSRWAWTSAYALLGINLILLLCIGLRGTVQQRINARQLGQEVSRLEPEVKKVRSVESQLADLQRRSELLSSFRKSNSLVLGALNELSVALPKNSYLLQFSIKDQFIEINGTSDDAATLPKILDDSPYFKNAEFAAPITRDSGGKEQFRIRIQVEVMPQASPVPSPAATAEAKNLGAAVNQNK
jgi:Tfp pilus assembly protein PilN